MTLTYSNFTCFADVERWYEATKPIISNRFTREDDVRPIGDRRRVDERIVRISPNCYALCDWGAGGRGPHFNYNTYLAPGWEPSLDDIKLMAPIVWERHTDGSETVRIRNGSGQGQHNSRYAFLQRHTPRGLYFRQTQVGMQFIRADKEYFLPKHTSKPKPIADAMAKQAGRSEWARGFQAGCDGKYLMFRKDNSAPCGWVHIYGDFEARRPSTPPVDKDAKAPFKQSLNEFYQWACAILPMFGDRRDYMREKELREQAVEHLKSQGEQRPESLIGWNLGRYGLPAEHTRPILTDDEHPLRMYALNHFFVHSDNITSIQDDTDAKRFRAQFNRWANKFFGFTKP